MQTISIVASLCAALFAFLALVAVIWGAMIWRTGRHPATAGNAGLLDRLILLAEQDLAGQRAEAESTRSQASATERALAGRLDGLRHETTAAIGEARLAQSGALAALSGRVAEDGAALRLLVETRLRELAETQAARLAEIQATVNEQLHKAVERQMETSFQRVIDQFTAVQKAMGDVQAMTAQIGDLRRIFSNVKTRGGWGETQLRALLDDVLPAGSYEMNRKLREGSDEQVEFALFMPVKGDVRPFLAVDAKFPLEDYERLLDASERGDADAERAARRALELRLRNEARKISEKYINPPVTVEFAVLYLPTDGLYAEIARAPGLIEELGRLYKVMVLGPSLLPALLRTVQLGYVTLALEQKADEVRSLLGATRTEMVKMDDVLEKLSKQAGAFSNTIDKARVRTRAVGRKLRGIDALDAAQSAALLETDWEDDAVSRTAPETDQARAD